MKEMIKVMIKNTLIAIGISYTMFCLTAAAFDIGYGGDFVLRGYTFTKMVIGALIIGIGFGAPTVVYSSDKLPIPMKVLIHMGIGLVIYFIVAANEGWMGDGSSPIMTICIVIGQLFITFLIWFIFMIHYRQDAKRMNERIQELKY